MEIKLEVLSGPNEGSIFSVQAGFKIGRTKGEIRLTDPKISGAHAIIETNPQGQLILVDLNSANGLILQGRKVKRIALIPGVKFFIGNSTFQVTSVASNKILDPKKLSEKSPDIAKIENKEVIRVPNKTLTWRERLTSATENLSFKDWPNPNHGLPFKPIIQLTFLQGIQSDQIIFLFYGPREAGSSSLDIELLDIDAPKKAFIIEQGLSGNHIIFRSLALGKIRLNGKIISENILKNGDLIQFGSTIIKVSFT